MNILFLSTNSAFFGSSFGGAESSMKLLANHLNKIGHNVRYFTKSNFVTFIPRFKTYSHEGINILVFHEMKGRRFNVIKSFNNSRFKRGIRNLCYAHNIEIIYCFYELESLKTLISIRENGSSFKIVMRMAGLHFYEACKRNKNLISEYEYAFNRIDSVNFIHKGLEKLVKEKFKELNMNVTFKHTIYGDIGSSVEFKWNDNREKRKDQEFKMIMASRFSNYQKRQDILVEAFNKLPKKNNMSLVLIGDGGRREYIQNLIDSYNLNDKIEIIPFLPQKDLWKLIKSSNLMCHACDYEGVSKIILESMQLGTPVLASDVEPVNKYITDGYNGFLTDNRPEKWAEYIEILAEDKNILMNVSRNSHEFTKKNYDPYKNVKLFEDQFVKLLNK